MNGRVLAAMVLACGLTATPVMPCSRDQDCLVFDPCVRNARCVGGQCRYDPTDCDDGEACTDDACDTTRGCVHTPHCGVNSACGEQRVCIKFPVSIGFPPRVFFVPLCIDQGPPSCDDGNACTEDQCAEPTGCAHTPIACDDGDVCTLDECDPASGCAHTALVGCCNADSECAGDRCTTGARCLSHACAEGTPVSCDDGDPCTVDRCNPADGCLSRSREGFDGVRCVCERPLPPACSGTPVSKPVAKRVARACALIARSSDSATPKARKLLGKAARELRRGSVTATKAAGKKLPPACANALAAQLANGQQRTEDLQRGL